tara:strand:+ start:5057 stop:6394 length:1338 start_codon:yes stop_codon:yes gene_type:complete
MKITVIGIGYVGLVTGTCLSEIGHNVICLDIDKKKIEKLKKGKLSIYEHGLQDLVESNIKEKRLKFTCSYEKAVNHSDIIFLAVDTPSDKNGDTDLKSIKKSCIEISKYMNTSKIIVEKSTVPVGTNALLKKTITNNLKKLNKDIYFSIVSNPEFLKEGSAVNDFMKPDRIIIGIDDNNLKPIFDEIYSAFNRKFNKIQYMDVNSAELTKYASNAMLATKISFINELAIISDKYGVDIENVRKGMGADKRIGTEFLYPGCGYGGSCFPKDINSLIYSAKKKSYNASLLKSVNTINENQKNYLFLKINKYFNTNIKNKVFTIWGLSFKPNTDDTRCAPSLAIINSILKNGGVVKAYDPVATIIPTIKNKNYTECNTATKALKNSDALVICTEWKEFWSIDIDVFKRNMNDAVIFDGRNIYNPKKMEKHNITYFGVGRGRRIDLNIP